MRRPLVIVATLVLLIVGGLAAATVVLANRSDDRIADGIRVGSVDVGGLTPAQARAKVHRELLAPLAEPIVVDYHGHHWRLTARRAKIHADVDAMVDRAVDRSATGNVVQRAWREATGGSIDATVPAKVSYSKRAVRALVERVRGDVDTEPRDAKLTFSATSLGQSEGHDGVSLEARALRRRIMRAIADPAADRTVRATVRTVHPDVTTADLAEQYPVVLTVDRASFKLRLFKNLKLVKSYDVGVGQEGLETPAGLYHIQNKAIDPAWSVPNSPWTGSLAGQVIPGGTPENPLKARWMGIFDGAGIHGIDPSEYGTIGTAASHGCVRMRIPDVEELYDQVPVNAPIYIA
jgi:lipoprotein-anchoring transpeptidase ErfK/SrfK